MAGDRSNILMKANIILIGMPGAGKSTAGVLLAKRTGRGFIDTDILIQRRENRILQEIVDIDGYLVLREIEERMLLSLDVNNTVIATGGSAVYSQAAIEHLARSGPVVFLDVTLDTLRKRISEFGTRGLACPPGQTLEQLFEERYSLYKKYASATVDSNDLSLEQTVERVIAITADEKSLTSD